MAGMVRAWLTWFVALYALYMLLVEIEAVFKSFKNDLGLRPIYHSVEPRVEAHIFVCFLAYCLQVTLQQRLNALAPGLTPRAALAQPVPLTSRVSNCGCVSGIADEGAGFRSKRRRNVTCNVTDAPFATGLAVIDCV